MEWLESLSRLLPEVAVLIVVFYFMDKRDKSFQKTIDRITKMHRDSLNKNTKTLQKVDDHIVEINGTQKKVSEKTISAVEELPKELEKVGDKISGHFTETVTKLANRNLEAYKAVKEQK